MPETLAPCGVTVTVAGREWFIPEATFDELIAKQAEIDQLQSVAADDSAAVARSLVDTAAVVMRDVEGWSAAYPDEAALMRLRPSDVRRILAAWTAICTGDAEERGGEGAASFQR